MTSSARRAEILGVAVFAKAPVPGTVKTRLAALLGAEAAAALHASLVRLALRTALAAGVGRVELWCAPDEDHPFFERCAREFRVHLRRQEGDDLGARMRHAFDDAFARGEGLMVIGSDCAALTAGHLRDAARALRAYDAVIIPAEDGGYVLAALARELSVIFEGIAWGGSTVMRETRARLGGSGASWQELPMLWDVDRPEDYARLRQERLLEAEGLA